MNALKWIIPAGIAGYLIYKFTRVSGAFNSLSYSLERLQLVRKNSSLLQVELLVTLGIRNPTSQALSFNRFTGSLSSKNVLLANIDVMGDGKGITVGPNKITLLAFPVRISTLNALNAVADNIGQWLRGNFDQPLRLQGTLNVAGIELPIDTTYTLTELGEINGVDQTATSKTELPFYLNY